MTNKKKSIDIKGNMYTLMSILLHDSDIENITAALAERVQQAPSFFKNTPVIVDFSPIEITDAYNFNALFKVIRQQQLLPVAVRGIDDDLREKMQAAGVPIVELASTSATDEKEQETKNSASVADDAPRSGASARIVERPVRSGQQCVAKNGDLILLSQISPSAELIAGGNIHVYGTLRGRALCGVHGDTSARIFCSALEADLVSVAGHYKVLEEVPAAVKNRPVQISLQNDQLLIEPL
jgi:septum site-determining protein MinC